MNMTLFSTDRQKFVNLSQYIHDLLIENDFCNLKNRSFQAFPQYTVNRFIQRNFTQPFVMQHHEDLVLRAYWVEGM